jgi:hypothetical protein
MHPIDSSFTAMKQGVSFITTAIIAGHPGGALPIGNPLNRYPSPRARLRAAAK